MKTYQISDFDAVAFDVEGTIADTIPIHHQSRIHAFKQHGLGHITPEQHALGPTYGSSTHDIIGGILFESGEITNSKPFDQNEKVLGIVETKSKLFKDAAASGFVSMPGAIDFINKIAPYFPGRMALVTSSYEEFVFPFIKRYKLGQFFPSERVIGFETVMAEGLQGKPSGDPFKLAKLRMKSTRLLVFEDTVPGVTSAKKADATVIALSFDKQNSLLFEEGGLEFPPDTLVNSYSQAAKLLGL